MLTRSRAATALSVVAVVLTAGAAAAQPALGACPNDDIRFLQGSEGLPDCRAFERVTPADKNGANLSVSKVAQSAPFPGAVAYTTSTGLPGSPANTAIGYYRAKREGDEWRLGFFDLPQKNPANTLVQTTRWIAQDLSSSISASTLALTPDTIPGGAAVYTHNIDSGALALFAQDPTDPLAPSVFYTEFTDISRGPAFGATSDLGHVAFDSQVNLTSEATPGTANVWEATGGELRLVSVLPDGTPSPTGGLTGSGQGYAAETPRFMSDDGSRIFFTAPVSAGLPRGAIYVRVDASRTILLSHSVRSGDDPSVPTTDGTFIGGSSDGRYAFFLSETPLTDDTTGAGRWLYRADAATGDVVRVAGTGTDAEAFSSKIAKRISDDGSRIYFTTTEALLPGAPSGSTQLYLWDDGVLSLVSRLGDGDQSAPFAMSDDGRYVEFASHASPTGYTGVSAECPDGLGDPGPCAQMYAFDAETGGTVCMTCTPDGGLGDAGAIDLTGASVYTPTAVFADGTRLFDTPSALVPQDTNRKRDVYSWKDGQIQLLTSGVDRNDARFLDASEDGTDIYVATFGQLVAADDDNLRDIYTVRRDGGLENQNVLPKPPTECASDGCQAPPGIAVLPPAIGSIDFTGPGDPSDSSGGGRTPTTVTVPRTRTVRGSSARIRVKVSGAGRIGVSGRGLKRTTKRTTKSGSYAITLRLTTRARRTLLRKHRVAATATVTFTSSAGQRKAARVRIVFTTPKRKGGR